VRKLHTITTITCQRTFLSIRKLENRISGLYIKFPGNLHSYSKMPLEIRENPYSTKMHSTGVKPDFIHFQAIICHIFVFVQKVSIICKVFYEIA